MKTDVSLARSLVRLRGWFLGTLALVGSVGLRGTEQTLIWTLPAADTVLPLNQPCRLSATSSSGLPVNYCVQNGPGVIVGSTLNVTNFGTIVVLAEQAGNADYAPASLTRIFNQSSVELTKRGGWSGTETGGSVLGVQVVGNLAYVAGGYAGLHIIDVSDPAHPVRKARSDLNGEVRNVTIIGTLAYVAAGDAGLQIMDVSNPASPVRVGAYDTAGSASDVQLVGGVAYVADGDQGLQIIDVSDSTNPVWKGSYRASWSSFAVWAAGNLAYLADRSAGLQIIDVSDPIRTVRVGGYYMSGSAADVQVLGTLAYLVSRSAGLEIVDVSNSAKPLIVGGCAVSGSASSVQVLRNLAYVAARSGGLQVFDVSNAAKPVRICSYQTTGYAGSVQVVGNLAYVAEGDAGLEILGVRDTLGQMLVSADPVSLHPMTLVNGELGLNLTGSGGARWVVESSSDMRTWVPVATNQAPFRFEVPVSVGSRGGFYRAVAR